MEIKEFDDVISLSENVLKRNRFDTDTLYNYARAIYLKNDRCKPIDKKRSVFLIMDILGTMREIAEVNSLLQESEDFEQFYLEIGKIFESYVIT